MKKIMLMIFTSILMLISCTDETPIQENINNEPNSKKFQTNYFGYISPGYFLNPVDFAGFEHNSKLDIFITNTNLQNYLEPATYQELITLFDTLSVDYIYDSLLISLSNQEYGFLINKYKKSEYSFVQMNMLMSILNNYSDSSSTNINTINNLLAEIRVWEDGVMSDLNYYSYDEENEIANQLLGSASILRYSLLYWITVNSDPNNPWNSLICPTPITSKQPRNRVNYLQNSSDNKTKFWLELGIGLLVVAGADVIGYYSSNVEVQVTENGVTYTKKVHSTAAAVGASCLVALIILPHEKEPE